jgi:outer membrane murein-binding lipoprotein Lpp
MNKALHVLVYVFLALAAAALWFELQLNAKRSTLTDRNRLQENYFVSIARTIEKVEPQKGVAIDPINMDVSPIEARLVDTPDTENVLEGYNGHLEQANLETYNWENAKDRAQLRAVYVLDAEGNPVLDMGEPVMKGPGTEDELLSKLFESAKQQQSRLNSTRAELVTLRGKLATVVTELNRIKPLARQDKVTIVEKQERITKLEEEKTGLENQVTKIKAQVEELNTEITSLKDEVTTAKDEVELKKEELAKANKLIEQLKKLLQESIATQGASSAKGTAVKSLPVGDKGRIIIVDNVNMFAIVSFSAEAMKELKGPNLNQPLPILELGVKRPGHKGDAGEFVGRLRIRQEVKGKPYVICDILGAWEQSKLLPDDVVFAD